MARSNLMKLSRAASRNLQRSSATPMIAHRFVLPVSASQSLRVTPSASRKLFTTSASSSRGIMPDTDDPHGKASEPPAAPVSMNVAELSDGEYHELSDKYLDTVVSKLEEVQEQREGWDVEFSVR